MVGENRKRKTLEIEWKHVRISNMMFVLALSSLASLARGDECQLSKEVPDVTALIASVKNVASPDKTALANMVGYLYFYDQGFLPFVLKNLTVQDGKMRWISDCATLSISYREQPNDLHKWELYDKTLEMPDGLGWPCILDQSYSGYHKERRLSCKQRMSKICWVPTNQRNNLLPSIELILHSFELELFGDAESIESRNFSFEPDDSGCWQLSW